MAKTSGINVERILEIAEAIIKVKGIHDTSLKDIAKAADISKGTLYYYYATKESLIYDIAGRHFNDVGGRLIDWVGETRGRIDLEEVLRVMLENMTRDLQMQRMHIYLLQEAIGDNEELRARFAARYEQWCGSIRKAFDILYGDAAPNNSIMADIVMFAVDGYAQRSLITREPLNYRALARALARALDALATSDVGAPQLLDTAQSKE